MTYAECIAALSRHPREAVVLATVAHVAEASLTLCGDRALAACVWALDSARRWALGEAEVEECEAAYAAAAYAGAVYGAATASAAAVTTHAASAAYAAHAATHAATHAAAYGATYVAESRAALVASLGEPRQWSPVHRLVRCGIEVVVAGEYTWVCTDGCLGYVEGRPTEGAAAVLYDECLELEAA
jgi:hypothetical protein